MPMGPLTVIQAYWVEAVVGFIPTVAEKHKTHKA